MITAEERARWRASPFDFNTAELPRLLDELEATERAYAARAESESDICDIFAAAKVRRQKCVAPTATRGVNIGLGRCKPLCGERAGHI
jgi:hypothetical protein